MITTASATVRVHNIIATKKAKTTIFTVVEKVTQIWTNLSMTLKAMHSVFSHNELITCTIKYVSSMCNIRLKRCTCIKGPFIHYEILEQQGQLSSTFWAGFGFHQ